MNFSEIMNKYQAHPTAVIDEGALIGEGCTIWHFCHISGGASIGKGCTLGQNVYVAPKVNIGQRVKIQNNVSLFTGVIVEDDAFLGPSCVFTNILTPRSEVNRKDQFLKTTVKKGASIGANAVILCGNEIGRYAMVGAGSVVTKSIKDFELVAGNPAVHFGWVGRYGEKLHFDSDGWAECKKTGNRYFLSDGEVKEYISSKEKSVK